MPKPSQSGKKRFFYNQNLKRDKSSKKYKNLTDHTIGLIKRLQREGMTKLIANALNKAQAKIKSYGITGVQMISALEHKGLSSLIESLSTHLVFVQKKWHNVSISTKRDIISTSTKIVASNNTTQKEPIATAKKVKEKKEVKIEDKKTESNEKTVTKKKTTTAKPVVKKTKVV